MTYANPLHRSGLAAIAAVLALSSTPLLAQEATSAPDPLAATPTAEAPAEAPVATAPAADPLAPTEPVATTATTARSTTRTSSARPAVRASGPAAAARSVAPRAATPAPAPAAVEPLRDVAEAAPVAPLAVAVPAASVEVAPAPARPTASMIDEQMLPIAGAAGLGLLALAGAGIALRRRKLRRDDIVAQEWHEPAFEAPTRPAAAITPVPASIAPRRDAPRSAFGWDSASARANPVRHAPAPTAARHDPVDAPAGSRVEAAYRGPTADNPSLSLKKRLKRAAFFDQRERLVAAGQAAPIARDAGLPDAVAIRRPAQRQHRTLQPA